MGYVEDIQVYTDNVDEDVVAAMENTYRLVLSQPDAAYVAYTDPEELETVKKNFLIGKLGLSPDDDLDGAIEVVGEKMKGVNRKNRLVVYYLLADHLGKLDKLR